jgi:glycosyltransferase involved in cell wall biosynthesis
MLDRKIRVLQLIDSFTVGGAEKLVLSLATNTDPKRFDVIPCALFQSGPLEQEMRAASIEYRILGLPRRSVLAGPFFIADVSRIVTALRRILQELSIDILHTHLTHSTLIGFLATRQRKSPVLCATVHNVIFDSQRGRLSPRTWLMRGGIRTTFSRAGRLIAVSTKVADALQLYTGIPKDRITTIPNGVSPARVQSAEDRDRLRYALGLPADRSVLVSVGRLTRQKGYPYLLRALASMCSQERPLTLIAGDGPDRADLEAKMKHLRLEEDVWLLGNRQDIPDILAAADLFVLASLWEGLPLALLEAMAAGLPAVVTAVGENTEVIEAGKSGFLVPPADEPTLADAIRCLLREPDKRKRMGKAARERFERHFSLGRCIQTHEILYQNMVANNQALTLKRQI